MKRKLAYLVLTFVLVGFVIREAGQIYGTTYGKSFLPSNLRWIEGLDKQLLWFATPTSDFYSILNYGMIVTALLILSIVRAHKPRIKPAEATEEQATVKAGENPFFATIPGWQEEKREPQREDQLEGKVIH